MPTITASSGDISLTSRRSGATWSTATWAVDMVFSAPIPANAQISSAALTVTIKTAPAVAANVTVDGQAVRTTSTGDRYLTIAVSPGTSSRNIALSYKAYGTQYSTSIVVLSMSLSIAYEIPFSAAGAPSAVSLSASIAEGAVTLSWSGASSGTQNAITGYEIQYADSANGSAWGDWNALTVQQTTATYGSASLAVNPTRGAYRRFRVRTRGAAGENYYSAWATTGSVRTNAIPSAPSGLSASPLVLESGAVTLTWAAATDATDKIASYRIVARISNGSAWGDWSQVGTTAALSASYAPTLSRGQRIQYGIYAVDSFGVSSASVAVFPTVVRNSAPSAPSGLSVTPALLESGSVTVAWTAATDPDAQALTYRVAQQTSTDGGKNWSASVSLGETTNASYTDTPSIQRGVKVRYAVTAVDALGAASSAAYSPSVTRNSLPTAPAALQATPAALYESGGIALTWAAATDPDGNLAGYQVQQQLSADGVTYGAWADVQTVESPAATLSPSMSRGTYVRFRVRAVDALGAASAWVELLSPVRRNCVPQAPSIYAAAALSALSGKPCFTIRAAQEPDGESMRVQALLQDADGRQLYGYADEKTLSAAGGAASFRCAHELPPGSYRVVVRLVDASGGVSDTASASFTVAAPAWTRDITSGAVIASETVSHQADLTELLSAVNAVRARFGLDAMPLPGRLGYFADWLTQMQALAQGAADCYALLGESAAIPHQEANYPSAATVNAVRALVEGV